MISIIDIIKDANFVTQISSFASANAIVTLSTVFVSTILSPLIGYIFYFTGSDKLTNWSIGDIAIGKFIESFISALLIIYLVTVFQKAVSVSQDDDEQHRQRQQYVQQQQPT